MKLRIGHETKELLSKMGIYDRFLKEANDAVRTSELKALLERCKPGISKEYEVMFRPPRSSYFDHTLYLRKR